MLKLRYVNSEKYLPFTASDGSDGYFQVAGATKRLWLGKIDSFWNADQHKSSLLLPSHHRK